MQCPQCGQLLTVPGAAPSAPPPTGLPIGAGPGSIGTRRREIEQAIEQFSMWKAFARAFVYPLTGSGWLMLIVIPLVSIPLRALMDMPIVFFLLVFLPCIAWLLFIGLHYGWIIQVIRGAGDGPEGELSWGDADFWGGRVWPALKILGTSIVILVVPIYITVQWARAMGFGEGASAFVVLTTSVPILLMWIFFAFYYPMAFTIVATYGNFLASINPVIVVSSIVRVPGEYALVWVFATGMYLLSNFALVPLASVSVVAANIVGLFFRMYVVCVIVSRLGFMAYRNRYKLLWG